MTAGLGHAQVAIYEVLERHLGDDVALTVVAREAAVEALTAAGPVIVADVLAKVEQGVADGAAEVIAQAVAAERARLAAVIPPGQFRQLADWFDTDDELKMALYAEDSSWPRTWRQRGHDVQDDLRRFADLLAGDAP